MSTEGALEQEVQDFREGSERVRKSALEAGEKLKDKSVDAWNDLVDVIRRHPGKAIGVALTAGAAIGTLATALSQRRSNSPVDNLRDLKNTGTDAWETLRSGFKDAMCTLKDAVDDASSKFK